ncbi:hypothetical protein HPB48_007397 [Haemaphysalis longicornis]|uniref:Uncharacterized protein n=1 Tax=Haemaphysalis longicornis TaxID=44386 RepID=A0A9J6G417_HAELO|nr:hypothetical protein HPB48_007397 [Haemaphysalis longicornis]
MEAAEPPAQGAATALGLPLARTRSVSTPPEDAAQATAAAGAAPKGKLPLSLVQAGAQPVVKSILKQEHPEVKEDIKGILKPEQTTEGAAAAPVKPILKPERSSPEVQSPSSSSSESSSEKEEEEEEDESSSESESESSSSEESSGPEEEDDKKKILLGGQRHLVIAQGSPSPQPGRKTITNPAVQRKLNASLRRKEEEER